MGGLFVNKSGAKYIWYDDAGPGRNLYGGFRKSFVINNEVIEGNINIFADSHYQLFINGEFIEFGPVRFDPRFPLYDSHDIRKYLRMGENVIAILVNYFGYKTYKSIPNNPGLIAWGGITTQDGTSIDLCTNSNWRAFPLVEYSNYSSKTSFALNAGDIFEQNKERKGWKSTGFADHTLPSAVEITNQKAWGELKPRNIPFMSGVMLQPERTLAVLPLKQGENKYSFSVPVPHFFEDDSEEYSNFIAFSTYVYSPMEQTIPVGVFWGETWLNGEELPRGVEEGNRSMRINQLWKLKQGYNYLFGKVGAYFDKLDQYFAVPKHSGVFFSAKKEFNCKLTFRHTRILKKEEFDRYISEKPMPYAELDSLEEIGGWIYKTAFEAAHNPCRESSWDQYGYPVEYLEPHKLAGYEFSECLYGDGLTVILDMGKMHLFYPHIRMTGVKDTIVDITYGEHLHKNENYLVHNHNYCAGDRILCSEDTIDWISSHPRGSRYVKITIRNVKEDITIEKLSFKSTNYPAAIKGSFKCSEKIFNDIWEMGGRTLLSNMEDAYVDCSGRERGMYGRDTIIQYHINLVTAGDHALMKRCMELYGQSPEITGKFRAVFPNTGTYSISDFALNMAEGYLAYYEKTGDKTRLEKDWEAIMKNIAWFNKLADKREDLLLDSEWHLKENEYKQVYGGFHGDLNIAKGIMDNTGIHCVFSCTYLISLKATLRLAEALGKEEEMEELNRRIEKLTKSIIEKFWDEETNCFKDNLEGTTHSPHASIFAIRADAVTKEQLSAVQSHLKKALSSIFVNGYGPEDGVLISPSFAFYILDGLYKADLAEVAEAIIKQGWGWMLNQGLRTCPEYFNKTDSLCHAWSASPTYYLSRYVLGINFNKSRDINLIELEVKAPGVEWAEGIVPHPSGTIEVKWHKEMGKVIYDYIRLPNGLKLEQKV